MATRNMSAPDLAAIPESEIVRPPLMVRLRPYLIALPALLVLIGILYPFVMGVAYSLTPYAFTRPNTDFVGLRNYMRMVEDSDFWYSTFVTLAYAFSATGVQLALGLTVAMLLNRESRLGKILQVTLIFPMMIAPVIATLIWKMMMQPFWFTFRNLTLPMLTPFILIVIIFRFMDSLKMFDIIFAMTEGGPGNTLMTYQLTAYRTSIQFQRLAQGLPYAIVLYIVIYFVSQWLVKWWGQAQRRAAGYS